MQNLIFINDDPISIVIRREIARCAKILNKRVKYNKRCANCFVCDFVHGVYQIKGNCDGCAETEEAMRELYYLFNTEQAHEFWGGKAKAVHNG